ncbi:flotillin family protein [bacterium CPR1]|nr:flotillin family protein [bacterium CPR1]
MVELLISHPSVLSILAAGAVGLWLIFNYIIRFIPNNRVGLVERIWSTGSVHAGLIALNGEAGFQPDLLRGGVHFLVPTRDRVHITSLVTIPSGKIGYIFARDGQPLEPVQTLAKLVSCQQFEDVRAFLANGGQRGPQRGILREGTYAINLAQFVVITEDTLYYHSLRREEEEIFQRMAAQIADRDGFKPVLITDDAVGVVTVHDGPSLEQGEIIAPDVGNSHDSFQTPDQFLLAGGKRGRQLPVLTEGTYYINRLFCTVELIPKTVVEVGTVGVVVSYTGDKGADRSGDSYRHGELVNEGQRGVWENVLKPGKYAINCYAMKVIPIPTTNFILKWVRREAGAHKFDENLSEVSLITKDAFEPSLPLSVVVHIDYQKAPRVIQRFGDIKRLVEQTLDPMVSAYFKNVGQTRTLIQLLQQRADIQRIASSEMKEKFAHYDLELEEVLIGTPTSSEGDQRIEEILTQLRARQIAEEQIVTYDQQEKAAVKERALREAQARAVQQQKITESELAIQVQTNEGKGQHQRALQQAEQIKALAEAEASKARSLAQAQADSNRMLAEAEATRIRAVGEAEADKAARVGVAQAIAIEEQVRAYGGPKFQLTQQVMSRFAEAVEHSGVDLVPRIVMGATTGGNSAMEALMALILNDRFNAIEATQGAAARDPKAEALRSELLENVANGKTSQ